MSIASGTIYYGFDVIDKPTEQTHFGVRSVFTAAVAFFGGLVIFLKAIKSGLSGLTDIIAQISVLFQKVSELEGTVGSLTTKNQNLESRTRFLEDQNDYYRTEFRQDGVDVDKLPIPLKRDLSLSVLIVDDDPTARKSLSRILMNVGCAVSTASNVAGAIDSLKSIKFDVVILDIVLSEGAGSGIDVFEYIREHHVASKVFLATACDDERVGKMVALRPDRTFPKPIEINEMIEHMRRMGQTVPAMVG